LDLVVNNNGHHQKSKFDNENDHGHFRTNILQTFMAQLHEQEQILSKLLRHVHEETIDDPMLNDQLECAPFFWTVLLYMAVEKHSR
jgi:hypothetical protein